MANAKAIGMVSLKGGVGKTTTAASVGASLYGDFGKRVLLIDGNLGVPNLGFHFNKPFPQPSLPDVLNGKTGIRDAVTVCRHGLDLLLTPLSGEEADLASLKEKLEEVRGDYDFIIIDSSPTMGPELDGVIAAADELILITSPDYPTTSASLKLLEVASSHSTATRGILVNKVRNKHFELELQNVSQTLNSDILAVVPDDDDVAEALSHKCPATVYSPLSSASVEFRRVAALLAGKRLPLTLWDKLRMRLGLRPHRKNCFGGEEEGG